MSDQAIKLFEALSGVDEELLERCNQKADRKNTMVYRLFEKYGRALAACFCLMMVGAAVWSGYRFVTASYGSDASGSNNSQAELSGMAQSLLTADGGSNGESGGAGPSSEMTGGNVTTADGTAGDRAEPGYGADGRRQEAASSAAAVEAAMPAAEQEPVQNSMSSMTEDKAGNISTSGNNLASPTENSISGEDSIAKKIDDLLKKENQITDSREVVPWEEATALEPFVDYLPTTLPAGYRAFSARRSSFPDSWNDIIFKWSDGEHILSLDMTLGEVMDREEIEKRDGINEYLAEEFRKELIPEPLEGEIRFTLYYADGMEISFVGYISADEMWEVVESVSK